MLTEGSFFDLLYDNENPEESYIMEGAYLDTGISRKGIKPLNEPSAGDKEDQEMIEGWSEDVVQIFREDEIELLIKYVRADQIRWNSMTAAERMEQEEKGDFQTRQSEQFSLCGYLDIRADDFPNIRQTWHGSEGNLYFLISEQGFEKIPTEKKTDHS